MKRGCNDSIYVSPSTQFKQKRPSLDVSIITPSSPGVVIDLQLPDSAKLAHAEFFLMTENKNGKVLGCGEEVHRYPEESRFVVRIYDRDFNCNGKLKDTIELDIQEFQEIHSHKSEIEKKAISQVKSRQKIFEFNDLQVFVGPNTFNPNKPTVEVFKAKKKMSMFIETFKRMMSHVTEVNENYSQYRARYAENAKIIDEIINALAFIRNEHRPNDYIRQPVIKRKNGILMTCVKIVDQARKIISQNEV